MTAYDWLKCNLSEAEEFFLTLLSSDCLVTEDFATWISVFLSTPDPLTHCVTFIVI